MRGQDDLAIAGNIHTSHQLQKFDLARRRQRRFRFVEDKNALLPAAFFEESQKTLAVGMREEVRRGTGGNAGNIFEIDLVLVSRNREKALGAKEPSVGDLGSQLARSALESCPPIFSSALE